MNADPERFPLVDIPAVAAVGRREAVEFLLGCLADQDRLPAGVAADLADRLEHRERLGSTAIGRGVAVPHARSDVVTATVGVIGRSAEGVPWPDAIDGGPVYRVCLLVLPAGPSGLAVHDLERLVRQLGSEPG